MEWEKCNKKVINSQNKKENETRKHSILEKKYKMKDIEINVSIIWYI